MLPMTLRKRAAAIGDTPPRPFGREICNQMPNPSISAPPPRSYRLWRHFPRHCDVTTRVLHPYKPRFLWKEGTSGSPTAVSSSRSFTAPAQELLLPALFPRALRPQNPDSFSGILSPACLITHACAVCALYRTSGAGFASRPKIDFRIPEIPVPENITSLLSSRRESGPSKPSRGTGYG